MSDKFTLNININLQPNSPIIKKSFDLLTEYILSETSHANILLGIEQINPILDNLMNSVDSSNNFIDSTEFKSLLNKVKLFQHHEVAQKFINLIEKDNISYSQLYELVENEFTNNNFSHDLKLLNHYYDFYSVLKNNLFHHKFEMIKDSWNENFEFFSVEKFTFTELNKIIVSPINTKLKNNYFKLIKLSQEKISDLLWNYFLEYPENYQSNSKYLPDFFQFIHWLEKPNEKILCFSKLLTQKHWNCLSYASQVSGFDFFLQQLFIKNEKDMKSNFDPFSNSSPEIKCINLDLVSYINEKNINVDIVLKNNNLGLPEYLREYLYYEINKLEQKGNKQSLSEFHELDKLLTIYEKQKLESIFVQKNIKTKTSKI